MSSLLFQLFQEAAQSSTELAARAMAGATAAGEVVERAKALGLRAVEEAERLHKEYTEAVSAIKHASEQAGQAVETAAQAVQSVTPEAVKAATAVNDMLTAVEGDAIHLGQERARVFHEVDGSARQAETGFHDLAAQVEAFAEHLGALGGAAEGQLHHFQLTVQVVTGEVAKAKEHVHEELDGLGKTAATLSQATAHAIEQMLAAVSNALVNYSNNAISGHNSGVAAVRHGYLDETKDQIDPTETYLSASFDKVREALAGFEQVPEPAHSALQTATSALVDEGEKAVTGLIDVVQNLQHSLDKVTA